MLFLDSETYLIRADCLAPKPVCWQLALDIGDVWIQREPPSLQNHIIVGHNIAYDLLCLIRHHPQYAPLVWQAYAENRVTDTMIRQRLLDIAKGRTRKSYSLADIADYYSLCKRADDPWRLRYGELDGVPFSQWPEDALRYATHDTEVTRLLYRAQGAEIADEYRQARAAWWLHIATDAGIYTDQAAVDALLAHLQADHDKDVQLLLQENLLSRTRDGKLKRNLDAARGRLNPLTAERTPSNLVKISEQIARESDDLCLQAFARYSTSETRMKRVELFRAPEIHPRYVTLVATGRTACTQSAEPQVSIQLQNMPRMPGMRECLVPAPGEVIIACDYKGAELCSWAQICYWLFGHSDLRNAINQGVDAHLELAKLIDAQDPPRQAAKAANFGFMGGLGPTGFVKYAKQIYQLEIEQEEAECIRAAWLARWSEAQEYLSHIAQTRTIITARNVTSSKIPEAVNEVMETSEVEAVGRASKVKEPLDARNRPLHEGAGWFYQATHFRSNRVRSGLYFTEAANTYFQGLTADGAKDAGFHLTWECERGRLKDWKLWGFLHDEFLLRGPEHDLQRAARVVEEVAVRRMQAWLPDVRCSVEIAAMRRWSKDAKPCYDARGVLIPWTPST